jgi:hypothetical protein
MNDSWIDVFLSSMDKDVKRPIIKKKDIKKKEDIRDPIIYWWHPDHIRIGRFFKNWYQKYNSGKFEN